MRHRNPLEAIARARDEAMAERAKQACEPPILPVCDHGTIGGEQFCIFCLRKLSDDAVTERDALAAEVERLRIRCRLASTTLEFIRGEWVPAGDEEALALVTYATSPSPETGHVGWCWWAKGKMGDAGSLAGAMLRAERALAKVSE